MPRGYRYVVLAAVGLLALAAAPTSNYGAKADQPHRAQAGRAKPKSVAPIIQIPPQASAPDRGCREGQDDRQSDLCAQWKAADAAADAARWTFWTMLAGIVGLFVGAGTLFFAAKAATYAKHAANETKFSNDLVKRPWLDVMIRTDLEVPFEWKEDDTCSFGLLMLLTHHGSVPAKHVHISTQIIDQMQVDQAVEDLIKKDKSRPPVVSKAVFPNEPLLEQKWGMSYKAEGELAEYGLSHPNIIVSVSYRSAWESDTCEPHVTVRVVQLWCKPGSCFRKKHPVVPADQLILYISPHHSGYMD